MNKQMLLMLGGGAVILWYLTQQKAVAAPAAAVAPKPAAAQPQPSMSTVQGPAAAAPASALKQKIEAAILAGGGSNTYIYGQQSPDVWNWHAMQAFPGWTAPSPDDLYPGEPNVHAKMVTFADWFGRVQPFLVSGGLSGFRPRSPMFSQLYGGWMT